MVLNKANKIITSVIIAVIVIACIAVGIAVFKNVAGKPSSGNGIYYSQQDEDKYLQFNGDNTFSYTPGADGDVSNGNWEQQGNKIMLTFTESDSPVTFIKAGDYIYREDKVFRGITSNEKLLNNRYVLERDGEIIEEMWFLDDGTVDHQIIGDSKINHGTYTRVEDILIVRYNDNFENEQRFLVLDNGISKDIFCKSPIQEVTE